MRIRAAAPDHPRAWEIAAPPGTTVAAVAAAVGLPKADHYALGGRAVAADECLVDTGADDGALLGLLSSEPQPATVALVAVEGPHAGAAWPLATGWHSIGCHPSVSILLHGPAVSGLHAELCVGADGSISVRDRSSAEGTWLHGRRLTHAAVLDLGSELRVGTTTLRVVAIHRVGPPSRRGVPLVHRPPRVLGPPTPAMPSPPPAAVAPTPSASLRNLASMLVPSLAAVALAAVVRPEMVVLALLAPIAALSTWGVLRVSDTRARSRAQRAARNENTAHVRAMTVHEAAIARSAVARHPDIGELSCRIRSADVRLWERRSSHDDFLEVALGTDTLAGGVPVGLTLNRPIGIVGPRADALALARSLVLQVAAHHGPADVALWVWTTDPLAWRWMRWLPNCSDTTLCSEAPDVAACALARGVGRGSRSVVLVLDADGLPAGWREPWRSLHDTGAIVIASQRELLPEQCRDVIALTDRSLRFTTAEHETIDIARRWQINARVAEDLAAMLAPMRDPDLADDERCLPRELGLLSLLAPTPADDDGLVDIVRTRWHASRQSSRCAAPVGVDTTGPFVLDLVADGPHGLVAGTTGSGKSEFLRTLVVSFAATVDAEHLAFVLVDYKGGSAFDGLATLPHVVDVITDLDAASAMRAVRGLEAEVHRRERVLRDAGVTDIAGYHEIAMRETHENAMRKTNEIALSCSPAPRLLIVVDEFATMAQELPAFVDALVDIAQRGRSLGVHLVLATQRPTGAVKDAIRTNTNLRIALRVVDSTDSRDVIGADDAAMIGRDQRGRAIARLGSRDLRAFQSAYVSGVSSLARARQDLRAAPLGISVSRDETSGGERDLDRLVRAVTVAHRAAGHADPTRPWSEPLPCDLSLADLRNGVDHPVSPGALDYCLIDDASAQSHVVGSWSPSRGNLLVAGMAGSGTTTALCTLAAAACLQPHDTRPDIYVIASTTTPFVWLEPFDHVGGIVACEDDERVRRLLRMLCARIERRLRGHEQVESKVLVLIDGIGTLRATNDSLIGLDVLDRLDRVATDGPSVGVHLAVSAEHPAAVGHRIDRTIAHRIFLRLGDRTEYASIGARDIDPTTLVPGRGVRDVDGAVVHIAQTTAADIARISVAALDGGRTKDAATRVGALPVCVRADHQAVARIVDDLLRVPLGVGDTELASIELTLHPGEHALVIGPARSGKSNVLEVLRDALLVGGIEVIAIGTHRSRLSGTQRDRAAITALLDALGAPRRDSARTVVVVDDGDAVDDGGALERLVAAQHRHVHVVAAARGDRLRGLFRHWSNDVRRSGNAVLLRPDDGDADLVGVRLPRVGGASPIGRGWLVCDGAVELTQFAHAHAHSVDSHSADPHTGRAA